MVAGINLPAKAKALPFGGAPAVVKKRDVSLYCTV